MFSSKFAARKFCRSPVFLAADTKSVVINPPPPPPHGLPHLQINLFPVSDGGGLSSNLILHKQLLRWSDQVTCE